MDEPLSPAQIDEALSRLPGWRHHQSALVRSYRFASFRDAMAFMAAAAADIDRLGHHPEWSNCYDRVSVRLTTHDAGDLVTARDVDLAQVLERHARQPVV